MHSDAKIRTISNQVDKGGIKERPTPVSEIKEIVLDENRPKRKIKIGTALELELQERIIAVSVKLRVIFAWGPEEIPGVDRSVVCYRMSVIPSSKSVK